VDRVVYHSVTFGCAPGLGTKRRLAGASPGVPLIGGRLPSKPPDQSAQHLDNAPGVMEIPPAERAIVAGTAATMTGNRSIRVRPGAGRDWHRAVEIPGRGRIAPRDCGGTVLRLPEIYHNPELCGFACGPIGLGIAEQISLADESEFVTVSVRIATVLALLTCW
jgi:hypothetical protein